MFPPVCLSPTFGSRQDRQLADALMVSDGLDTDASAPRGSAKFLVLTGVVIGAQGAASRCFLPLVLFSLRVSGV